MTSRDDHTKAADALRQKAESLVREEASRTPGDSASLSPEKIQQTLYQLRVHQIELELQNEELRTAQARIEAERARYFHLYDLAPVGYCTLSKKGLILEANLTAATLLGVSCSALFKQPITRFILKDDQDIYYLHGKKLFETGEPRECELRLVKPDGAFFWAHLRGTAAQAEDGALLCRVVISDITERKRSEDALRESEEKYRLLFDNLNEGIWQIDKDGYTVFVNDRMAEMLGYTVQEMQGKHLFDFMDEQEAQLTKNYMQRRQKGIKEQHEHILVCKDGSCIFTSLETSPVYDKKGEYIGALSGVQDVTARKQAEKTLRESENYYRAIFETSGSAMFIIEKDTTISRVNSNFEKLLGYAKQEVEGKKSWTEFIHPDDLGWMKEYHYMRRRNSRAVPLSYEFRFFARNGELRHGYLTVDIIAGAKQSVASIIDITERKLAEEERRKSEERYRTILNEMSEGYQEVDLSGNFTFFNEAFLNIFGYNSNEMMGTNFRHYAAEEAVAKKVYRLYNEMYKTGVPIQNSEWDIIRKDGERRTLEFYASVLRDSADIPTGFRGIVRDITERKRVEDKLRESEQKYRFMTEQMNDVVWTTDLEMRITYISPSDERILGFTPEERMEHTLADMLTPFSQEKAMEVISKEYAIEETGSVDSRRFVSIELEHRHKDGSTRLFETHATAIRDDEGRLIGLHGVSRDITERKQAEMALRESEQRFKAIIQNLPGAVFAHDLKGRLLFVNKTASANTGYSEQELLAMTVPDIDSGGFTKDDMYQLWNALNIGESKTTHSIHTRKDGSKYPVEIHLNAIYLDNQPVILPIVIDISDRKQAEKEIAEQHSLIKAIYSNAPLIMMVVDGNRRLRQVNVFATHFAGRPAEEMLGLRGGEALRCLHALDDPRGCGFGEFCSDCAIRNKILETLENCVTNLQFEAPFYFSSEDGTQPMTLMVSTTPITFQDENMALVIIMDVTERKQTEKEREKLQSQLNQAQKMESVGRLAGGVAHDFNNKLSVINGYAELAMEEIDPSEPLYETIQEIHTAGQQSADIVRQLLAFARKQNISPVMLDLNDTISGMLKMLQRLIGENIDLAWHPGKNLWPVKIDPSQVDQIMANLAVNSRDAISDVGKLTIETNNIVVDENYCRSNPEAIAGQYVMLAVSDDGCGIEEQIREQLFDPYFTTKEVGKGTGLGLPTIYGIVKQNNGFINVYSEPGEGTTFKLYFPSHEETKPSLHSAKESTGRIPTGTETVLVVEDEKTILQMSKQMLERLGYTVETAGSASEALQVSEKYDGSIDLLITDVIMPGMNGRDLSSQLLKNHSDLKTLYMSGYTANVIAHHGVLDEGVQFIQKPFALRDLAVKVREVLKADRAIAEY